MRRFVGLCGYAGSGKDTAALGLVRAGWTRVAFADPLKDVALILGWDGEKNAAGRRLLQHIGEGLRKHVDDEVWIRAMLRRASAVEGDVVVTDVRYPNEATALRRRHGYLVRIDRPGVGPANDHASERVDLLEAEYVLVNDSTPDALQAQLYALVEMGG